MVLKANLFGKMILIVVGSLSFAPSWRSVTFFKSISSLSFYTLNKTNLAYELIDNNNDNVREIKYLKTKLLY